MSHRVPKSLLRNPSFTAIALGLLLSTVSGAEAAAPAGAPSDEAPRWSLSLTPVYQWDAKLDQGGEFSSDRVFLGVGIKRWFGSRSGIGVQLDYDYEDYDFDGVTDFGGAPWNTLHRFSVGLPLSHRTDNAWLLLFSPSVELSAESGADLDDAWGYGAVMAASRKFSADLRLGLGVGAFRRIEENTFFPFLAVRWQITDRLRLSNPFRAGPSGPAGLELVLDMGNTWKLAAGGAWRTYRFRLDKEGRVPGGIGETEQLPLFLHASKQLRPALRFDFYVGAALAGELTVKNSDRQELVKDDYDTAPFIGISLGGKF